MKYSEVKKDLFTVSNDYALCHCISEDYRLGMGIAVQFEKRFKIREKLKPHDPIPCMLCGSAGRGIFNLVTKVKYWHKPSYFSVTKSITDMKEDALKYDINKIAMPMIAAGLDGLNWTRVSDIIKEAFIDTDIEILVCRLK